MSVARPGIRLAIVFALLQLALNGIAPARADVLFPPGSRIGISPPPSFVPSALIRGFEDGDKKAAMLLFELPVAAFAEISKSNSGPLKAQGVVIDKRETIPLASAIGGKALLLLGHQKSDKENFRKWILVAPFANLTAVVSVQAAQDASNAPLDKAIRTALATVTARPEVPMDEQLALLPFRITDSGGFRPVRIAPPTTEVLTDGSKDVFEDNEQPILIISAAPGSPENAEARETFASNLFSGFTGLKDVRVVGTDMIRMNGQQMHQIMAEAKNEKSGEDVRLVQWVKFGRNAFIRFIGIAKADAWADAFPRMRTARDSTMPGG